MGALLTESPWQQHDLKLIESLKGRCQEKLGSDALDMGPWGTWVTPEEMPAPYAAARLPVSKAAFFPEGLSC